MNENQQSPWIVQEPKAAFEPLPVGFYLAAFKGVQEVAMKDGAVKWRFAWEVGTGENKGKMATALTDRSINPKTLPGVLISGLLGRALQTGENLQAAVDACVGKSYMTSIQPGPKGGKPQVRMVSSPPPM